MEALKDVATKLKKPFEERAEHPFGGPYLFSWVVCNHNFLMVVLSAEGYEKRIESLAHIFPRNWEGYFNTFALPFLFASGYVLLSPMSELIVKSGASLTEKIWRWLNGNIFKTNWYSEKEVGEIRSKCDALIEQAENELKISHSREDVAKSMLNSNKEKFTQLLEKYLRAVADSAVGAHVYHLDKSRLDLVKQKFTDKSRGVDKIFAMGVPQDAATFVMGRFSGQGQNPLEFHPTATNNPHDDIILGYLFGEGMVTVTTMGDYSIRIRLTEFGSYLMDEIVRENPSIMFADSWVAYIERERSLGRA